MSTDYGKVHQSFVNEEGLAVRWEVEDNSVMAFDFFNILNGEDSIFLEPSDMEKIVKEMEAFLAALKSREDDKAQENEVPF